MEIQVSEEQARVFWQDEEFHKMFAGCKHVNAGLFAKGKHIFLTPASIVFERYGIELEGSYAESLTVVVEFVPKPE